MIALVVLVNCEFNTHYILYFIFLVSCFGPYGYGEWQLVLVPVAGSLGSSSNSAGNNWTNNYIKIKCICNW